MADAVRDEMREVGRGMGRTLFVFMASTGSIIMMAVVVVLTMEVQCGWGREDRESWDSCNKERQRRRQLFEDVTLVSCRWRALCKRGSRCPRRHSSHCGHSSSRCVLV